MIADLIAPVPEYITTAPIEASDIVQTIIEPVELSDRYNLQEVIRQLVALPNNWDNNGAVRPDAKAIINSYKFIESLPEPILSSLQSENITPTPYGTIVLDFYHNENCLSIEVGNNKIGYFTNIKNEPSFFSEGINVEFPLIPNEIITAFDRVYS